MHTRRRYTFAMVTRYRGPARRDAPADDPGSGSTEGGSGTSPADDPGSGGTEGGDTGSKPKIDGDLDKDRAARTIAAARDGEKKAKEAAKAAEKARQDLIDGIAVALGLKPDPKTDPAVQVAQAAKELTDVRAENAELKVENALLRLAGKAGGDVDALRDSRGFMTRLAELDPADKGFEDAVVAVVKDAVKTNPKLAATAPQGSQGPARQGTDHNGGTGTPKRPASLGAAISARMSGSR